MPSTRERAFTTVAGPLEFYMNRPEWDKLREMMLGTGLWDAHQIGLTEMYFDLFGPVEREEDWYRKITTELYGDSRMLCLTNKQK